MHYFKHFKMNPVYQFRIIVEPRINTTFNGQSAYNTEYSIAFFTDYEAIISINMQQDNIVNIFIQFHSLLQFQSELSEEPVAVEPSQPTISESSKRPDPTPSHGSAELNYIPIRPPSPIPFSDDSM